MRKNPVFIANVSKMGDNAVIIVPKKLKDLFETRRVMVEVYDKEGI